MAGPYLPVEVDTSVRQVDGDHKNRDIYQTHRGKAAPERDSKNLPPQAIVPDGPVRYTQD